MEVFSTRVDMVNMVTVNWFRQEMDVWNILGSDIFGGFGVVQDKFGWESILV